MKLSDRHGTAILTDCGNFTPNTNYSQGHLFCTNCPGWRQFHEPYRSSEINSRYRNWSLMIDGFTSRTGTVDEWREAVQRVAHYAGWMVRTTRDDVVHDYHTPTYRIPRVTSSRVEHHFGFPHLLLVATDRTEQIDPLDWQSGLAPDPRPGGIIAAWIANPEHGTNWHTLSGERAAWARAFTDLGYEAYIWHRENLAEIVHRLTGRHYTAKVNA